MNSDTTIFKLTAGLLALALLIGGAGVSFPLLQLLLGAAAVLVAAYLVISAPRDAKGPLDRWALILLGLTLLIPLLQLVPLPPAVWHLLPGREVPKDVDAIIGWAIWRPLTLDVEGTIRSWLVLIPAAVVFVASLRMNTQDRARLLWVVIGFALLNALLGIIQLATGGSATPYPSTHTGHPVGFFVNRNHSAAIMLAAMPLAAALGSARGRHAQGRGAVLVATTAVAILAIVVIGTTSRTGLVLLPIALGVSLFILFRPGSQQRYAVPALLAVAVLGLVLVTSPGFDRVLSRFGAADEPRFAYWADVQWALQHYGLAGTGVGTFVPVFQSAESLESIAPILTNHAHNDYLEILLDGGIPAALLFSAFLILIAVAAHRSIRSARRPELAALRFASATGVTLLLAYSVIDYPLRMPAIAAAFAVCCAVLLPSRGAKARGDGREISIRSSPGNQSKAWLLMKSVAGLAGLGLVLGVMAQAALSARAISQKRYTDAANWASWSTRAHEGQANIALQQNRLREASRLGSSAYRLSPISAPAIRTLALVRLVAGDSYGHKLMQIGAALGWRDPVTQLWAIAAAQRSGEAEKAMQRAEGLFRQRILVLPALHLLLGTPDLDPVSRFFAVSLAQRPDWRKDVFRTLGKLSATDLAAFQVVLAKLNRSNAPATSEELSSALQELIAARRVVEAQRIWTQLNPGLVENGEFNLLKNAGGISSLPAGWDVRGQNRDATSVATYDPEQGNRGLRIAYTDMITLLSQEMMLPAGTYTLSYQAREVGPVQVVLRWQLRCRGSKQTQTSEARVPARQGWQRFGGSFDVPPRDCPVQRLALQRTDAINQTETWLDSIRFTR